MSKKKTQQMAKHLLSLRDILKSICHLDIITISNVIPKLRLHRSNFHLITVLPYKRVDDQNMQIFD